MRPFLVQKRAKVFEKLFLYLIFKYLQKIGDNLRTKAQKSGHFRPFLVVNLIS